MEIEIERIWQATHAMSVDPNHEISWSRTPLRNNGDPI